MVYCGDHARGDDEVQVYYQELSRQRTVSLTYNPVEELLAAINESGHSDDAIARDATSRAVALVGVYDLRNHRSPCRR